MSDQPLSVVKLGGSLLDLPGVWSKLRAWLDALPGRHLLLIGGGAIVEVIRRMDAVHDLGKERAHWSALRAMEVNARLAAVLLPSAKLESSDVSLTEKETPIVNPLSFGAQDALRPDRLPLTWDVTSDSMAARLARDRGARKLFLLKSCSVGHFQTWEEFAARGIVDKWFPNEAKALSGTEIVLVNFRELP
jgi:aspartokinase-like uncharacterized kinase